MKVTVEFPSNAFDDAELAWGTAALAREHLFDTVAPLSGTRVDADDDRTIFVAIAVARALGLHDALVRESPVNAHAVAPLLRALAETVVVALEVRRNAAYASVVLDSERRGRRRKLQTLLSRAKTEAPGLKVLTDWLSETSHFGSKAAGLSIRDHQRDEGGSNFSITSDPTWPDGEGAARTIARHVAQLTEGMAQVAAAILHEPRSNNPEG